MAANDNYRKVVSRNYSNSTSYDFSKLPKSGFNLGYNSKYDGIIGRLHVGGYSDVMAGDKFQGFNGGAITMDSIVTPITSNLHFRSHNFFVKYRSLDSDFEELMSPNKLNNQGANLSTPCFKIPDLFASIIGMLSGVDFLAGLRTVWSESSPSSTVYKESIKTLLGINSDAGFTLLVNAIKNGRKDLISAKLFTLGANSASSAWANIQKKLAATYCDDTLVDLIDQMLTTICSCDSTDNKSIWCASVRCYQHIIDFFMGQGSNLDRLGYPYISHDTLNRVINGDKPSVTDVSTLKMLGYYLTTGVSDPDSYNNIDFKLNEYKLRALMVIWIEYYREVRLEPLTKEMRYRKWDSTPFLGTSITTNPIGLGMLVTRMAPWGEDLYTTAQIDDICRHVYAPIINQETSVVANDNGDLLAPLHPADSDTDLVSAGLVRQTLSYIDSTDGTEKTIDVDVPTKIGTQFIKMTDSVSSYDALKLDLFTMRQSVRLEKWLKRHMVDGDEYRDRVLADYGVSISDADLLRPKYFGGSIDLVNSTQQISNVGTSETPMGTRQAIASCNTGGDQFGDFAEEFGVVIQIVSMVPEVQYDPINVQNTYVQFIDFPQPLFAASNESIMHNVSMSRNLDYGSAVRAFGYVPYAYEWRSRVNEVHGKFCDEYSDWTDIRFFGSTEYSIPKLNYKFLHCRPNIGYMANKTLLDGQWYNLATHGFNVERSLPTPVETI